MVERHALEPPKAAVGLESLGKLDHARHFVAIETGEQVIGETAHGAKHRAVSGC